MNTAKVQTIINELIAEQQTKQVTRKQYPVAKHQIVKLTELGIIAFMPANYGYTDAAVVIEAATTAKTAVFNAMGEGEEIPAEALNAALTTVETDDEDITDERDALDDLMDEVSAIENAKAVKEADEYAEAHTDWSY